MKQVKAISQLDGLITKNNVYTVLSEIFDPAKRLHFSIIDDRGVQCTYAATRFEIILTPKGSPDFSQMQQIADEVKNTQSEIVCPVVEEAKKLADQKRGEQ